MRARSGLQPEDEPATLAALQHARERAEVGRGEADLDAQRRGDFARAQTFGVLGEERAYRAARADAMRRRRRLDLALARRHRGRAALFRRGAGRLRFLADLRRARAVEAPLLLAPCRL